FQKLSAQKYNLRCLFYIFYFVVFTGFNARYQNDDNKPNIIGANLPVENILDQTIHYQQSEHGRGQKLLADREETYQNKGKKQCQCNKSCAEVKVQKLVVGIVSFGDEPFFFNWVCNLGAVTGNQLSFGS